MAIGKSPIQFDDFPIQKAPFTSDFPLKTSMDGGFSWIFPSKTASIELPDVHGQRRLLQGWRGITQHQRAEPDAHSLGLSDLAGPVGSR